MRHLITFLISGSVFITTAGARPGNYQAASSVLGQPDFTSDTPPGSVDDRVFKGNEAICVDPATGKLFVGDYNGHRILRFSSVAAYQNFPQAEVVFGQTNFTDQGAATPPTAASLNLPTGLVIDSEGNLYVADLLNKRVLVWKNASSVATNGANADVVIGQDAFDKKDSPGAGPHTRFEGPYGVAIDADDNLYVSDYVIHRVLRFDDAPALVDGMTSTILDGNASAVFGQPNSSTFAFGTDPGMGDSILFQPKGIWVDKTGHLWVVDSVNFRLLLWDSAATRNTGDDPDGVLGQPDFASTDTGTGPASFSNYLLYVAVDDEGTAWVSDSNNARVVGFKNAAGKANGAAADFVLGQADLNSIDAPFTTARSTYSPKGLALAKEGGLFVSDYAARRVLYFENLTPARIAAVTLQLQQKLKALRKAKKARKKAEVKKLTKAIRGLRQQLASLRSQ